MPLQELVRVRRTVYDANTKTHLTAPEFQLIIYKDSKGNFNLQVMELTPTGDYALSHQGFTGDKDFSGVQILRSWSGKFINGNKFENGKIIGRIKQSRQSNQQSRVAETEEVCEDWLRQYIYISCINYYGENVVVGTVVYYKLGTFQPVPAIPSQIAPGSYVSCEDGWQNTDSPDYFQICAPDPDYDPFNPGYPSNPSDPFNPMVGSGATALLELYNNKKALFGPCPGLTDSWQYQINFKPNTDNIVKTKLERLATNNNFYSGTYPAYSVPGDWYVQTIESAVGTEVNLDNFSVFMSSLPTVDGVQLSVDQFANYIRLHLNDFVDTSKSSFEPHPYTGEDENGLWQSSFAEGAVILIHIPVVNPSVPAMNDGSVIVTQHYHGSESSGWTFSTIHDPFASDHPVSGTRTFTLYETSGGYMFTTQGADRLTNYAGQLVNIASNGLPFEKADELWSSMQTKLADFLNTHQSTGQIINPVKNRPNWAEVKRALDENRSLSTLPCN